MRSSYAWLHPAGYSGSSRSQSSVSFSVSTLGVAGLEGTDLQALRPGGGREL